MAFCKFLLNDGTSNILLNDGISVLLMNDNSCQDGQPEPTPTPPALSGGGHGTWRTRKKRPKKEALWELDQIIVALRAMPAPTPELAVAIDRGADIDMSNTLAQIESEIVYLRELLAERDDEDAILMLLH
jgi:hypothetical protein